MTITIDLFLKSETDFIYSLNNAWKLAFNRDIAIVNAIESKIIDERNENLIRTGYYLEQLKEMRDLAKMDRMTENLFKTKYSDRLEEFYAKRTKTENFINQEIAKTNDWNQEELVNKSEKTFTALKNRLEFSTHWLLQEAKEDVENRTEGLKEWAEKFEILQKNYETKENHLKNQLQ